MPTYTGISSEAFRYLLDRQAEQALRILPGFYLRSLSEKQRWGSWGGSGSPVGMEGRGDKALYCLQLAPLIRHEPCPLITPNRTPKVHQL